MIDAEFLIPFTASSTAPAELPEGYLKASACRWLGQNEGVLSSSIKHFLHTGSNLNMPVSHTLKFQGQLRAEKFAKAPVKISADWHLPPEQPALSCSFNMPKHSLQQPIQLNNYLPIPHELAVLKGLFSISGQADCRPGDAQMQLQVQAQHSDWQAGELAAEAVNANWQMNIKKDQTVIPP